MDPLLCVKMPWEIFIGLVDEFVLKFELKRCAYMGKFSNIVKKQVSWVNFHIIINVMVGNTNMSKISHWINIKTDNCK